MRKNKYPIFVLSKGRYQTCYTARFLLHDKVEFYLVVEPQEYEDYKANFPDANIIVLPEEASGHGAIPVRNWIWEFAKSLGHKRHWQLDDNITEVYRWYKKKRIRCDSLPAFVACEDFTDRYTNIAISGMNYTMFAYPAGNGKAAFHLNCRVYSCLLIDCNIEQRWRGEYNADTDLCLQVLAAGYCTVLFNAFLIEKKQTMVVKGGNTERYKGDGRLKMARSLERIWPEVVTVDRRFKRPQHVVKYNWTRFDTSLIRNPDFDWASLQNTDEYGLKLIEVGEVRSKNLKKMLGHDS